VLERKADARQLSKCRLYVDEVERATHLLLLLAARLARLDNCSTLATPGESPPTTPTVRSPAHLDAEKTNHTHTPV